MKLGLEIAGTLRPGQDALPPAFIAKPQQWACLHLTDDRPTEVWQHIIDGLTEQVALLDEYWTIVCVNRSWAKAAEMYGHFDLMAGSNYLHFCRAESEKGMACARDTLAGVEQIIQGERSSFRIVYRPDDRVQGHDFQVCINRFEVGGKKFASVTRYDVTELLELRRLRENFSDSVIRGQAEERRRMGREIHDSTMQLMACIGMKIGQLSETCQTPDCNSILEEMRQLVDETQLEIRSIAYLAHPPLLDKMTLREALKALAEGFGRRTMLNVEFEVFGDPQFCCPAAEGAIYRIAQEALSNVHRHSKATQANVRLCQGKAMTHVVVADNGIGLPGVIPTGVGLSGMRSRLSELGGRLLIRSRSPGTAVIASVPTRRRSRLLPA
jgi:two-component system, NarL family, sensor kinase